PDVAIRELEKRMSAAADINTESVGDKIRKLEATLTKKAEARTRLLNSYANARFTEAEVDRELETINRETAAAQSDLQRLRQTAEATKMQTIRLRTAREFL